MPNHDSLWPHEHLFDEQTEHPLTFRNRGSIGCSSKTRKKALEILRELEIRLPVHRLCFLGLELSTQGGSLLPEFRRAAAELLQCDQLLLIGLHEAVDGAFGSPKRALKLRFLCRHRARGPQLLKTAIEFRSYELGIGDQGRHVVPDQFVQVILAHGEIGTDATLFVAVVVGAQATVVVELSLASATTLKF